jgi:hypothetical protein
MLRDTRAVVMTPLRPFALAIALTGCSAPQPARQDASAAASQTPPPGSVSPASATALASASVAPPSSAPAIASAAPTPSTSAIASATSPPSASASAAPAADLPLPKVDVKNIGMHIGGVTHHDPVKKAPIRESVEPHMDEFRRCFALAEDPKKGGDFGVDLLIEKDGGKAELSHPRTSLEGKAFKACVIEVFEKIDFQKPKDGKTKVSYSLRFTPTAN